MLVLTDPIKLTNAAYVPGEKVPVNDAVIGTTDVSVNPAEGGTYSVAAKAPSMAAF
jgi:hypothetical protein